MSTLKEKRLLEEVLDFMRLKHYSLHTERTYCDWIKRYILFHGMTSRKDMLGGEKKNDLGSDQAGCMYTKALDKKQGPFLFLY